MLKTSESRRRESMTRRQHNDMLQTRLCTLHVRTLRGGVAQLVACLISNRSVVSSNAIKGSRCFLGLDTVPLLVNTDWLHARTRTRNFTIELK